jgi:beta-aspartyl-peptidase (threonine type)
MPEARGRWSLILHGGAKRIAPGEAQAHRLGCLRAAEEGVKHLAGAGSAIDAVEAAIRILEADSTFNAGYGSVLNADGEVETDAAMMEGGDLAIGAIAGAQGLRHPISVARLLVEETPTLVVGPGARRFAEQRSAELCPHEDMIAPGAAQKKADANGDTVGCIALDQQGRIAVGVSTGGCLGKCPVGWAIPLFPAVGSTRTTQLAVFASPETEKASLERCFPRA